MRLSFHGRDGETFVGLSNYQWLAVDSGFRESMFNNFLWLLVVPALATFFGLVAAVLTDRIWWGNIAKSLIFMPMAISFVGASVIWKFVYDYRAAGEQQIGILNAFVTFLGGEPQAWITVPFWNNFFLMAILIWIQTGFAMVILSAALRGIPEETIEAAIIDGANGFQIFFRIMVPQIAGTIAVVWTTITILVLKVFDIVFAMTNGQWNTQVLANYMYDWMFRGFDFGRGAAIAMVIMLAGDADHDLEHPPRRGRNAGALNMGSVAGRRSALDMGSASERAAARRAVDPADRRPADLVVARQGPARRLRLVDGARQPPART